MTVLERSVSRRVAAASERLAARLGEAMPAAMVQPVDGGVAVSGVDVRRRHLTDPALRWPAGLLR